MTELACVRKYDEEQRSKERQNNTIAQVHYENQHVEEMVGGHLDQFCSAHELKDVADHELADDGKPKQYPKKPTNVQCDVAPLLADKFRMDSALISSTNSPARTR